MVGQLRRQYMESDPNPFPKIDLFPRITKVVHFLFHQMQNTGLSDHNRGGGPALDRTLYDTPEQLELDFGTLPE